MRRRVYTTSITDVGSAGALQYALGGPPSKRKARVLASTHIDDFASRRAYRMYQQASSYVESGDVSIRQGSQNSGLQCCRSMRWEGPLLWQSPE